MSLADAEHFVRDPDWTWYILFYFFLAGLSGGSYLLATLLRLFGDRGDEPAARVGYYISFLTMLLCPVLLTLDLGQPLRFWHMLVNTTPGDEGPIFKYWSPMSVGAWALVVFSVFATVSFFGALVRDGRIRSGLVARLVRLPDQTLGKLWITLGALVGLFIAGYTGVLLAVSNQPVWSDSWALGGLFLASGLSGSAALMAWLVRKRADAQSSATALIRGERYFAMLEFALIAVFALTLISPGALEQAFGYPWALLWVVALLGLVPGLRGVVPAQLSAGKGGALTVQAARVSVVAPGLVLIGVLALRAAVIFSVQ